MFEFQHICPNSWNHWLRQRFQYYIFLAEFLNLCGDPDRGSLLDFSKILCYNIKKRLLKTAHSSHHRIPFPIGSRTGSRIIIYKTRLFPSISFFCSLRSKKPTELVFSLLQFHLQKMVVILTKERDSKKSADLIFIKN